MSGLGWAGYGTELPARNISRGWRGEVGPPGRSGIGAAPHAGTWPPVMSLALSIVVLIVASVFSRLRGLPIGSAVLLKKFKRRVVLCRFLQLLDRLRSLRLLLLEPRRQRFYPVVVVRGERRPRNVDTTFRVSASSRAHKMMKIERRGACLHYGTTGDRRPLVGAHLMGSYDKDDHDRIHKVRERQV